MGKRGPRTVAGKRVVSLNAVKHGVLAATPVLPEVENPQEYANHKSSIVADLEPANYLETVLAERIADYLWRHQRVVRYERAATEEMQRGAYSRDTDANALPRVDELEKIMRYEAHLNRQLRQDLHELEALQTRRQGGSAPLARLDVHGSD